MSEQRRVSAPILLAAYTASSLILVIAFEFVFPTAAAPLPPFFFKWRLFHGIIGYAGWFPAIALAAIAGTFGFGEWGGGGEPRFSPNFLHSIKASLMTAVAAAILNAALALLLLPIAQDSIADMKSKGILFRTAEQKAEDALQKKNWKEASGYLKICQQVWPNSEETEKARDQLSVGLTSGQLIKEAERQSAQSEAAGRTPPISGIAGVTATTTANEALDLARKAFAEKRLFDAHWLATLSERLAKPGAAEKASAARLAADAWNAISSTEPNAADKAAFAVYKKKREGYAAILAEDWIRAYYIYEELSRTEKKDPDVARFFKLSEQGTKTISFFSNEIGASIGAVDLNVVLSLPRKDSGRDILRVRRLHPFADAAYGEGLELLSFDAGGTLRYQVEAQYVKIVPFRLDQADAGLVSRSALLMQALDREDASVQWKPRWIKGTAPGSIENRIVLDVPYENMLLAARARRGTQSLSIPELYKCAAVLPQYGFLAEAFRAELLKRFVEPFSFLSLAIFVLAIAWRARASRSMRAAGIPILVILPFAFDVAVQGYKLIAASSATLLAVMLPFPTALAAALGLQAALLFVALFVLAGQRS